MKSHDDYLDPDRAGLNDEHEDNSIVEQAFSEYNGPGEVYRITYKYTACGPSVGFLFEFEPTRSCTRRNDYDFPGDTTVREWVYCDSLYQWGSWKDLATAIGGGVFIRAISVSSIVEGVDAETSTHIVACDINSLEKHMTADEAPHITLRRLFDEAVKAVDEEASQIWDNTH